jgi:acyl carrier protein
VAGCPDEPTIGKPIFNTSIYLLDGNRSLVPIGAVGELHIAGDGMARGYLNNEALTAEKFLPNPFSDDPGDRLYRTGDLARWLPNGNVEFLGRVDHQVKIRGFRIELGEIETVLLQHPRVKEVVVLAREDEPGDKRLVAYVVESAVGNGTADRDEDHHTDMVEELRSHMQRQLPDFMVPAAIVMLPTLPLTLSGKVDRKVLPAPDRARKGPDFVRPEGPTEELLAGLWCDLLNLEHVSRYDAFFALGGHSLLATQLASRIRDAFRIEMPIRTLFYRQTLVSQAQAIAELEERADALRRRAHRLGRRAELLASSSALQEGEI